MILRRVSQGEDVGIAIETLIREIRDYSYGDLIHIVLTGGGTGMKVTQRLREVAEAVSDSQWKRVHLWWGDERFIEADSTLRNDYQIHEILGKYFATDRVHRVASSDTCASVDEAAALYAAELSKFEFPCPQFALTFLGLGPDGHIASLFPHTKQLHASAVCVPIHESPKPPPQRVSMTLSTLNSSEKTLLFASGDNKEAALARLIATHGSVDETPARGIAASSVEILA